MSEPKLRHRTTRAKLQKFFARVSPMAASHAAALATIDQSELATYFSTLGHHIGHAARQQEQFDRVKATKFNVFGLIEPDENKLSDIIANLLDSAGNHGQGALFLRLFLKRLKLEHFGNNFTNARVRREAPTTGIKKYRRRMDVLVEAGVVVAIENKVDSLEQKDQVSDYLKHLGSMAGESRRAVLVYLTPNGRTPTSLSVEEVQNHIDRGTLCNWSYHTELRAWLDQCRVECRAKRIQFFLADFVGYIESHLRGKPETEEDEEDETEN